LWLGDFSAMDDAMASAAVDEGVESLRKNYLVLYRLQKIA
jgi:hypothetical protein